MAQTKTKSFIETQHGTLQSANAADLVLTGNGGAPVITLKNAAMASRRWRSGSSRCGWESRLEYDAAVYDGGGAGGGERGLTTEKD
jgi:hypothetical protein